MLSVFSRRDLGAVFAGFVKLLIVYPNPALDCMTSHQPKPRLDQTSNDPHLFTITTWNVLQLAQPAITEPTAPES